MKRHVHQQFCFLFFGNEVISLESRPLIFVYVACVAGAKGEGDWGGRKARKQSPIPLPFSLPPYPLPLLDARYAGYVYVYTRIQSIQKQNVEYDIKINLTVDKVRSERLLARKSCFV